MKHQTQPTWNSCTSTCLAIITGQPVQDVIDEFHDAFHSREMFEDDYLESKGIKFEYGKRNQLIDGEGIYLLTVPSLNIEGGAHSIVYHIYKEEGSEGYFHVLYDPAEGREGKKFYVHHFHTEKNDLAVKLKFYTVDLVIRDE